MKLINEIQSGDQLLTIEKSQLISTEFLFMLHQHQSNQGFFYLSFSFERYILV